MTDDIDFSGMTSSEVGKALSEKTLREMAEFANSKPKQDSRNWQDPEGYRYLYSWSNGVLLRFLIRKFTDSLPNIEIRRKKQTDDAGRSFVRNIEEGHNRPTTKEYLDYLGFSQGSLAETKGITRELTEDKLLKSIPGSSLLGLGINLKDFNYALRKSRQLKDLNGPLKDFKGGLEEVKGSSSTILYNPLKSSNLNPEDKFAYRDITDLYPPLKKIKGEDITYEIIMELINKTDYLTRNLVISLEKKLNNDKKYYQVEQIRLNRRSKGES